MTDHTPSWRRFVDYHFRHREERMEFALDISRMGFTPDWLASMEPACQAAIQEMQSLEQGDRVNTDEDRMVGHYWLRNSSLAPSAELRQESQTG
ncbi:MAG: glucose-6-phosphate isomerase, partial [Verrucomicrobiota bacterium]